MKSLKNVAALALLAALSLTAVHAYAAGVQDIVPAGAADANATINVRVTNLGGATTSAPVYVGTKPPQWLNGVLMTSGTGFQFARAFKVPTLSSALVTTTLPAVHNCWVYVMVGTSQISPATVDGVQMTFSSTSTVKAYWMP